MGEGIKTSHKIKNNPPRGRLPLDVMPFQFMAKPKDIVSIAG